MIKRSICLLLPLVSILIACGGGAERNNAAENSPTGRQTVRVAIGKPEKELTLTGKVACNPDRTVSISPLVNGVIERTYFSLGDKVNKGQVMLDIRSAELSSLQSEEVALKAELRIAQRELQAARKLYPDKMITEREMFEAEGRVEQAQAALAKLEADMTVFGASNGSGVFSIKAPTSGYVISKNVSAGSTVSAEGDPLFTVADLSEVWVIANVYASNLTFVRPGMEAAVSTISYPGEYFSGKIDAISQVFDPEEKALKARIVLPNSGLRLKPEMSAVIRLKEVFEKGMPYIPTRAVIFDDDAYYVIVRDVESDAIRPIAPFSDHDGVTYVSSGLSENEEVLIQNPLLIYAKLRGK